MDKGDLYRLIEGQCQELEVCLRKNNGKKTYWLVNDLTVEKQSKSATIQYKTGKCLSEEHEVLNNPDNYCSDL